MTNIQNLAKYLVIRNGLLKAFKLSESEATAEDKKYLRDVEYKIIIYKTLIKTHMTAEQLSLFLSIYPDDLNNFLEKDKNLILLQLRKIYRFALNLGIHRKDGYRDTAKCRQIIHYGETNEVLKKYLIY